MALFLHAEVGPSLPMSRWGHIMVSRDDTSGGVGSGTRILLLGGMNCKSYCEGSTVYEWCFDEKLLALSYDDGDQRMKAIQLAQQNAQAAQQRSNSLGGDATPKE